MAKAKQSSAMKLIQHVWDHNQEGCRHSWERLNQTMYAAVCLAIQSGMAFDPGDFQVMSKTMRIGRWCGSNVGEDWYGLAIHVKHSSAIAAFEQWRRRRPFIVRFHRTHKHPTRLSIGVRFYWHRESVVVTSFSEDLSHVVACTYQAGSRKVAKRFKISHDDISAYHAELRAEAATQSREGAKTRWETTR